MSDSQWEQVKEVFQAALEHSPGAERERYLDEVCGADAEFRAAVLDLLDSFNEADDFLDESPIAEVAEAIVGRQETASVGQQIGRYRIERKLGAGGMGEVFLARDTELERLVALKVLSSAFSGNPDRVRRFVQEARAVSALNHPNILTIHEIGHFENVRFIATEYVEGETLRERQRGDSPLGLNEILEVFIQTAAALSAAHAAKIVHRDIKPENVMIRLDGLVKVLDFGLAKLVENNTKSIKTRVDTTPGMVMGTVAYMSPEQARGLPTNARTDVWSLGVCLSEIVFGVQPFAGETVSDQIAAILKSEPEFGNKNVSLVLKQIIGKCLEKSVENRYQSIKDFSLDLKEFSKEFDFSSETDFSFHNSSERKKIVDTQSNGRHTVEPAFSTQNSLPPRSSSAEYIVGEIKKRKWIPFTAVGLASVILALILYFSFISGSHAKPISSLAVLPFANESGDTNDEYLSDGLSESLINKLSQLPQLKVASRSSAFKYKGKDVESSEAAKSLGVEAIVTGNIVRRGDDLQINVELINAADNSQIWGENYRRKVADAQAIQEEITQTVLQKLRLKLSGTEEKQVAAPITDNSQAYPLFLNGVFYRRKNGPENLKKAIEYQNQAIALDPKFALAYTELGLNYYTLVVINAIDPQTGMPPARQAIEKALSLNDTLAETHDLNSGIKMADFDWQGAEAENRRAIELNPNLAGAHTSYADFLGTMGRFNEAVREIRRAQELDPLRINLVNNEGEILLRARRYDEALAAFDRAVPEAANEVFALIYRGRAYAAKGRYDDAVSSVQKSLTQEKTAYGLIHLGRIYAITGRRENALQLLEEIKKRGDYVSPTEITVLYAALDMREQAFAELEKAYATRDLQIGLIKTLSEYDSLRNDPRFEDLLRRLNLAN